MNKLRKLLASGLVALAATGIAADADAARRRAVVHPSPPAQKITTIIPAANTGTDVSLSYHESGSAQATTCFVAENNPTPTNCRLDTILANQSVELKDYAPGDGMILVTANKPLEIRSDRNDGFPLLTGTGYLPSMVRPSSDEGLILYTGEKAAQATLTLTQRAGNWLGTNDPLFPPVVKEVTLTPYSIVETNIREMFGKVVESTISGKDFQIQIDVMEGELGALTAITEDGTTTHLPPLKREDAVNEYFVPHSEQHDTSLTAKNLEQGTLSTSMTWDYTPHGTMNTTTGYFNIMTPETSTAYDVVTIANGTGAGTLRIVVPPPRVGDINDQPHLIGWSRTDNIYIPFFKKEQSAKAPTYASTEKLEAIISNIDNNAQQRTVIYMQNVRSRPATGFLILTEDKGEEIQRIPIQLDYGYGMELPLDSLRQIENGRVKLQLNLHRLYDTYSPRVNLISITEDRATGKKTAAHVAHIREY